MPDEPATSLEERVLLLAPTRRDAAVAGKFLGSVGIALVPCDDLASLCREIERGAAVAIVPDEAILADRDGCLAQLLASQPPWSDLPLIVLTPMARANTVAAKLEAPSHMTLVRRPVEMGAFASTVRAAIRDRRRQYAMRAALAEREEQARALREADRHKDEFLAMLAHELRNPLAAVNNAVTVLKLATDAGSRKWASDVVERQVRQLARLIEDLLDASRITSGKIRLRKDHVDAGVVIDQAIESARPLIDERRQTLEVAVERGRLPLHVDPTRITQVVLNLLTNAAKYTDSGGHIWLTATREHDRAAISVRDDGMGIPPEKLPEIFGLFSQGDRSLARSEGGLGIGLTVVQKLTEMHGGTIEARSEGPDRGSEFVARLPLCLDHGETRAAAPGDAPRKGRAARILVVDDNVDTAHGLQRLLQLLGNQVEVAHDGRAALAAARAFRPEYILLDIGLPGMDGYQVAATLRAEETHGHTVIVAVSGYGQEEDQRRSREAGFDRHLLKPVDLDSLVSLLDRVE